jgi:hypothetical protein
VGRPKGSKNTKGRPCFTQRVCAVCGNEFEAYPKYRKDERRFCSVQCYRESRKGWVPSDDTRARLRVARSGKRPGLGISPSIETRIKLRDAICGSKSYRWKGGITKEAEQRRKSMDYRQWRLNVMQRDNFTCQWCGTRGGALVAHHIKPFSEFPDLATVASNGVTLCEDCHNKHHYRKEITI